MIDSSAPNSVRQIRAYAEDMYRHTLNCKPAVVAAFADVPDETWRLLVASLRWPANDAAVLAIIR